MSDLEPQGGKFRFGEFELRVHPRELYREGVKVRLQEKPFQVLALLVEKAGTTVTREEFRNRLWSPDTHVEFDANLNAALAKVRQALDESAESPRFIETVARLGYRFTAPVEQLGYAERPALVETSTTKPEGESRKTIPVADAALGAREGKAAALRTWLRRFLFGASLLVALAVPFSFAVRGFASRLGFEPAGKSVLVVLPFADLSDSPKQEYFSDGLTDELITQIGNLNPQRLSVIARTSAMHYKGTRETVEQIGRELGAAYALEGTVRRTGQRIHVTAQLVQTRGQIRLWAQAYDCETADLLDLQSDLAKRVAEALAVELLPGPHAGPAAAAKHDAEAYDPFLHSYL